MPQLPAGTPSTVALLRGAAADPAEVLRTAAAAGHRRLYIDGGRTIQSFLAAGLIAELTVTTVPVLLGAGIRLFGALRAPRDPWAPPRDQRAARSAAAGGPWPR